MEVLAGSTGLCAVAAVCLAAVWICIRLVTKICRQTAKDLEHSMQALKESQDLLLKEIGSVSKEMGQMPSKIEEYFSLKKEEEPAAQEMEEDEKAGGSSSVVSKEDVRNAKEEADALRETLDTVQKKILILKQQAVKLKEDGESVRTAVYRLREFGGKGQKPLETMQKQAKDAVSFASKFSEFSEWSADLAGSADLLALNASIEAAREEEGEKFSAVASEMRKLAEESRTFADRLAETCKTVSGSLAVNESEASSLAMQMDGEQEALEESVRLFGSLLQKALEVGQTAEELSLEME